MFCRMEQTAFSEQIPHSSGVRRLQLLNDLVSSHAATAPQSVRKAAEEACALCKTLYPQVFTASDNTSQSDLAAVRRPVLQHTSRSFANLGMILLRLDEPKQGMEALSMAMSLATAAGDDSLRIRLLNEVGMAHLLYHNEPYAAQATMEEALSIAARIGDSRGRAITLTNLSKVFITPGQYDKAVPVLDEALALHRAQANSQGEADTLYQLGQIHSIRGDTGKALQLLLRSLHLREQLQLDRAKALSLMGIGNVYQMLGEYTEAQQYHRQSLALFESMQDMRGVADTLLNIGNIYRQMEDISTALEYYNRSLDIRRKLYDRAGEAVLLNNIGSSYTGTGDFATAHIYLKESLALCEQCGDQDSAALALLNIGLVFIDEEDFVEARAYIIRALAMFRSNGNRHDETSALISLGKTAIKDENPEEALACLHQALSLAETAAATPQQYQIHEALSMAWEQCGDSAQALQHYRKFHELREQMFNDSASRRLQALHVHYEVERSRKEAEVQRRDRERLEREMELKNRELTATTMLLAQKNDMLRELYSQIKEIKGMPESKRTARLRELMLALEDHLSSRQTWEAFEQHFTQIHGAFYTSLLGRCRDLSPAELKVCALIRLNLTMKEIASLLAVTVMTVKKHRYNIRRKLGLEEGENLSTFMASL